MRHAFVSLDFSACLYDCLLGSMIALFGLLDQNLAAHVVFFLQRFQFSYHAQNSLTLA